MIKTHKSVKKKIHETEYIEQAKEIVGYCSNFQYITSRLEKNMHVMFPVIDHRYKV